MQPKIVKLIIEHAKERLPKEPLYLAKLKIKHANSKSTYCIYIDKKYPMPITKNLSMPIKNNTVNGSFTIISQILKITVFHLFFGSSSFYYTLGTAVEMLLLLLINQINLPWCPNQNSGTFL